MFTAMRDGVLLCKLINKIKPESIPKGKFSHKITTNVVQMTENVSIGLHYAKTALGCRFQNIGASDIVQGNEMLILSLVWQLIKLELGSKFVKSLPKTSSKEEPPAGHGSADVDSAEAALIRWVNDLLISSSCPRLLSNFSGDLKDSVIYVYLLNRLVPGECTLDLLEEQDLEARASCFLDAARKIGCGSFVTANTIIKGNSRMNFGFLASLFSFFSRQGDGAGVGIPASSGAAAGGNSPTSPTPVDIDKETESLRAQFEQERAHLTNQLSRAMGLVQQQAEQARLMSTELETTRGELLECLEQIEVQDKELTTARSQLLSKEEEIDALAQAIESLDTKESSSSAASTEALQRQVAELTGRMASLEVLLNESQLTVKEQEFALLELASAPGTSSPSPSSSVAGDSTMLLQQIEKLESSLLELAAEKAALTEQLAKFKITAPAASPATSSSAGHSGDSEAAAGGGDGKGSQVESEAAKQQRIETRRAEQLALTDLNQRLMDRLQYLSSRFEDDLSLARAVYIDLSAESFSSPQRSGMLTKQGGSVKSWKRRYFLLKDNFLFYYKTSKEPKPLGVVHLDDFLVDVAKPDEIKNPAKDLSKHCFKIVLSDRTYFICSERQIDMDLWIDQIKNVNRWYLAEDSRFRAKTTRAPPPSSAYDDY
ncbi:MAG: hypothetical protein Q8P67_21485 [archaeon]|nr:hypothetical protein [archaeon]